MELGCWEGLLIATMRIDRGVLRVALSRVDDEGDIPNLKSTDINIPTLEYGAYLRTRSDTDPPIVRIFSHHLLNTFFRLPLRVPRGSPG